MAAYKSFTCLIFNPTMCLQMPFRSLGTKISIIKMTNTPCTYVLIRRLIIGPGCSLVTCSASFPEATLAYVS